ncbi:hypothetical protein [Xanthobacter sp.]|uniref:hypothetical protein n=1 Tax=Xanthobacter sp. TaxID=35809 RepID=UPI0025EBDE4A|nr:hypothetical protein [Xanthobacter sp.]
MKTGILAALAVAATLATTAGAQAQVKPYGAGFDGWNFTATTEKPGLVNCRATRRVGGRDDIIARRTDGEVYLSVKAEGRKGDFKGTIINVPGKPRGMLEWTVPGGANGARMWFTMPFVAIDHIVAAGAYQFSLPDSEDVGTVNLGKRAKEAWARVNQCVQANGG